ncbi:MAG: PQQ-binding-like beta-propeller repeat protein [Kiritimatiellae bacterium]|jgi:outer membrane protein assembly factor BamB|nr:PQQ-binding-like beta-propeller repeat protein [Kiritimatiellia bacterium]
MRLIKYLWVGLTLLIAMPACAQIVRWGGGSSPNCVGSAVDLTATLDDTLLWSYKIGTHQYSIPTVDRGKIYMGTNDGGCKRDGYKSNGGSILSCLDQKTGELVWSFQSPRNWVGDKLPYYFNKWRSGFISAPVVVDDRIFIVGSRGDVLCFDCEGQTNGNDGSFVDENAYMELSGENLALNAKDGDILWQFDMLKELDVSPHDSCGSTILYLDGLLYINSSNGVGAGHIPADKPDAPTLFVLEAASGKLVAVDNEKIGRRVFHGSWSSPCYGKVGDKDMIFFGAGDGFLYAFDAVRKASDGKVQTLNKVWAVDCNPPHFRVRDGKEMEYSSWNNRKTTGPCEPIGTPVFLEEKIYVAIGQSPLHGPGEGCLSCFDALTGEVVWRNEKLNRSLATVAISKGIIYLPDMAGDLHAFDQLDGETLWTADLGGRVQYANAYVADEKIFIGTERGRFWIFEEGREKKVISHTKLPSAPITAVASDGVLYVPMQNRLNAYSVR